MAIHILQSYQQCMRFLVCPHPYQHWVFCLSDYSHSSRCAMVFHCSLICVSPMTKDAEHLFMYVVVICMSALVKCLPSLLPIFKNYFLNRGEIFTILAIKYTIVYNHRHKPLPELFNHPKQKQCPTEQ